MSTILHVDGFDHQSFSSNDFGGTSVGLYDTISNGGQITADVTNKRTGSACVSIVQDGLTITRLVKTVATQHGVLSFYVRIAAAPSVRSQIFHTAGAGAAFLIGVNTNGTVFANIGGSGEATGPLIADDEWHRIDLRWDSSADPYTWDVQIDGVDIDDEPITRTGLSAANVTSYGIGANTATHTLTCLYDDLIYSETLADFPLGGHRVLSLVPTSDGTHVLNSNIVLGDGSAIVNAYAALDEWPPTATTNHSDTITQPAIGASDYAEVRFPGPTLVSPETIHAVVGLAALGSDGTAANHGITRIVGDVTDDIYDGDMSETANHYRTKLLTAPTGGWTEAAITALRARVGFSTDAADDPEWRALMLMVAAVGEDEPEPPAPVVYTVTRRQNVGRNVQPLLTGLSIRDNRDPTAGYSIRSWHPRPKFSDLQPAKGGPIARPNAIDVALDEAARYGKAISIRLDCGRWSPTWAQEWGTVTITDRTGATFTCPQWWQQGYIDAYEELIERLAALYDGRILDITVSGTMTEYAEPLIRQAPQAATQATLEAAGFTTDLDAAAIEASMRAHAVAFESTRSVFAFNPAHTLNDGVWKVGDLNQTLEWIDMFCELLGKKHGIIGNDSLNMYRLENSANYVAMYDYMWTKRALGFPVAIQTATWDVVGGRLIEAMQYARRHKVHLLELPLKFATAETSGAYQGQPDLASQDLIDLWDRRFTANARPHHRTRHHLNVDAG